MSEETKSFGRQCIYCRRIHSLGFCGYGISKGVINEHKMPTIGNRKSKGNPQKKPKSRVKMYKEIKHSMGMSLKTYALMQGVVKRRLGKSRIWEYKK